MPASDVPHYRTPSPDAGHEAIRKPLADAIDQLSSVVDDLDETKIGVDDAYFLTDLLFGLITSLLAQLSAVNIRIDATNIDVNTTLDGMDALQVAVADLAARVEELEERNAVLPGPDAAG